MERERESTVQYSRCGKRKGKYSIGVERERERIVGLEKDRESKLG